MSFIVLQLVNTFASSFRTEQFNNNRTLQMVNTSLADINQYTANGESLDDEYLQIERKAMWDSLFVAQETNKAIEASL